MAGGENAWGEVRPRLWFSADGETLVERRRRAGRAARHARRGGGAGRRAVGEGFVAVGSRSVDNEQDGVAWFSADGESWEEIDDPDLAQEGRQAL